MKRGGRTTPTTTPNSQVIRVTATNAPDPNVVIEILEQALKQKARRSLAPPDDEQAEPQASSRTTDRGKP